MEFTNQFRVSADLERTYRTLTDLTETAACIPGAAADEISDETATGTLRVKVGPLTVRYEGSATKAGEELDIEAGQASVAVDVDGEESPGAGTAHVQLRATLAAVDQGTDVTVDTVVEVTGKAAQFGKAVVGDVVSRMTKDFGERLADNLAESQTSDDAAADQPADGAAAGQPADDAAEEKPADGAAAEEPADGAAAEEPADDAAAGQPADDPADAAEHTDDKDVEVAAPAAVAGTPAPGFSGPTQASDTARTSGPTARPDAVNAPAADMPWDEMQADVWELPGRNRREDLKLLVPLVLITLSAGLLWWWRRR